MWVISGVFGEYRGRLLGRVFDAVEPRPTRDYMRARMDLVTALLKINTRDAVSASLEHLLDMLRLCRGDNLGVRDIVPGLYLRLRRDQECYDFLKWYGTQGQDADYAWGDMSLPFLNLKDEDSTESPEPMWTGRYSDTAHAVAVLMIKLRMLLDLKDFEAAAELYKLTGPTDQKLNLDIVQEIHDKVETRSGIWSKHPELLALEGMKGRIASLEQQIDRLYSAISQQNKFFWKGLAEHEKWLKLPPTPYSQGSKEEMVLLLHHHARSWIETEGSLEWAKLKLRS
jgi:hypothetical protein